MGERKKKSKMQSAKWTDTFNAGHCPLECKGSFLAPKLTETFPGRIFLKYQVWNLDKQVHVIFLSGDPVDH